MLKRLQDWNEKEIEIQRAYEEIQLKIEKANAAKNQIDADKEKMENIALEVGQESKIICDYKASIEKTKEEMEQMRFEIDSKEAIIRSESAKLGEARQEINLKHKALEELRRTYLKDQSVADSMKEKPCTIKSSADFLEYKIPPKTTASHEENSYTKQRLANKQDNRSKQVVDSFKASDFLKELERDVLSFCLINYSSETSPNLWIT